MVGCKRVSNNEIDATIFIKEFKTDIPIPNAKVTILRGKPLTGYGTQAVKELTSDADGKVLFNEEVDKAYDYFAEAEKDDLYPDHRQVILTRGKKCFETTLVKYVNGYVRVHLVNKFPFNQSDIFEHSTYCPGINKYIGVNIDTTFLLCDAHLSLFEGEGFGGTITKNLVSTIKFIPFVALPRDTINLEFYY